MLPAEGANPQHLEPAGGAEKGARLVAAGFEPTQSTTESPLSSRTRPRIGPRATRPSTFVHLAFTAVERKPRFLERRPKPRTSR